MWAEEGEMVMVAREELAELVWAAEVVERRNLTLRVRSQTCPVARVQAISLPLTR